MDRTLKRAKRNNKRRGQRNGGAWRRFSPDGKTCRYCEHDGSQHLVSSGQPHFFRPVTEAERRDPYLMLYRHNLPEGGSALVRRMTVANHAELITAFCTACAESIGTHQVCATRGTWQSERWWACGGTDTKTWQSPPDGGGKETNHDGTDAVLHLPALRRAVRAGGGAGQGHPYRGDIPLRLLRHPGDIHGDDRGGLRAAAQGEKGLPLLPARTLPVRAERTTTETTEKGETT